MLPNRTIAFSRSSWEDRAALVEDGAVVEIEIERRDAGLRPGDVYAGRLRRVVSGLDAAFVDLGDERPAYLPLPASERTRLGALPRGRTLLVQVVKAPLGGKGARVSAAPVLSSQSWVLNTGSKGVAISRKIADAAERDRLRGIGARFSDAGYGWIARTAAAGRSEVSLAHEASVLLERWRELESAAATIVPPQRLQPELDLPFRWLRDRLDVPGTRIVVDGAELGAELGRRMEGAGTRASVDVEAGPDSGGAFAALGIDRALREAVSRIVRLPSGGHVTIDRTEALTVVDVDTGRSVGTRDLENTILATNLEAARAIARQIRLRNMGGIVVIDFIDMAVASNRERVSSELRAGFATDPLPWFLVGFGATFNADLGGGLDLKPGIRSLNGVASILTTVDQESKALFSPDVGAFVKGNELSSALENWTFGFTWRYRYQLDLQIPLTILLSGIPLKLDFKSTLLYTPETYTLGTAYHFGSDGVIAFDLAYNRYSNFKSPSLVIDTDIDIPILPLELKSGPAIDPNFSDTWTPRIGADYRVYVGESLDVWLRGGYSFDPSPAPKQTRTTNFVDGDKHIFGIGTGFTAKSLFGTDVSKSNPTFNLTFQTQLLSKTRAVKDADVPAVNPGQPVVTGEGVVYYLGAAISADTSVP